MECCFKSNGRRRNSSEVSPKSLSHHANDNRLQCCVMRDTPGRGGGDRRASLTLYALRGVLELRTPLSWLINSCCLNSLRRPRTKTNTGRRSRFGCTKKKKNESHAVILMDRPNRLTQCCTQFKSPGVKILCVFHLH